VPSRPGKCSGIFPDAGSRIRDHNRCTVKINNRIIVILCFAIVALLVALTVISHFLILATFSNVEYREATADTQYILTQLNEDVADVATSCSDWAKRDDTYTFVTDLNPGYVRANLADPTLFRSMKINYVLFYNASGHLVYSAGYNLDDGTRREVPEGLDTIVRNSILPEGVPEGIPGRRGYSLLNGDLLILAGDQIIPADHRNGPAGTLVMVRQLGKEQISNLAQQSDLDISVYPVPEHPETGPFNDLDIKKMQSGSIFITPVNDSVMEGAAYLTGIENTPTKILVIVKISRYLYQLVQTSLAYVIGAIIILAFVLIFVIRWPLKKYITNPILSIDAKMKEIGLSGNISREVMVKGDDEIVSLAGSLNRMLLEIRKAQQKRLEVETRYRILTETSVAGIFVFREKILYANPAGELQTGYTKAELLTMNFWDFVHPEFQELVRERWQKRQLGEDVPPRMEFKIIRKDGGERWIDGSTTAFLIDGQIASFSVRIDITERKRIEQALRENEEKFRALTENTPDIIFSADMDGLFTYISPNIEKYGFTAGGMVGKSLFTHVHPEDQSLIREVFRKRSDGDGGSPTPFRILDRGQNIRWLEVNSTLMRDPAGECTGIQGVIRDITERRNALDAITLANKKLNIMYDITRHDILNKITILFGLVDMTKICPSPGEREQFLEEIRDAGNAIYRQIALTRDYQEVGVNSPRWVPLKEMIERAISNFSAPGIRFSVGIRNIEVYADPLIEKVIYNLVDNAIRYGKKITCISFSTHVSDRGLELICEDNGIGIAAGEKEKIFERGFGNNTGLGLFLSREILLITGITLRETGEPGTGARFVLSLPKGTFRFTDTDENDADAETHG
jgi:PAS domain S-box-containing protein